MKKKTFAFFLAALIILSFLVLLPQNSVFADCGNVETTLIDCDTASGGTLRHLAIRIVNVLTVGIGIVGVIGITLFGIQMVTSRDNPTQAAKARTHFFQIVLGLAVFLVMWTGAQWLLPGGAIFERINAESVLVNPSALDVTLNETGKLIAAIYPLDADDQTITWISSDPTVATVDENGIVTGHSLGEAVITATASNGDTSTSTITVVEPPATENYCDTTSTSTSTSAPTSTADTVASTNDTPYVEGIDIHFVSTGNDDDAILIRSADKVIVIDGGRCNNAECAPGKTFVNYLKKAGVTKIDALIGSHAHWNHIQAHSVIADNFPIATAYYPVDLNKCVSKKLCEDKDIKFVAEKLSSKNITTKVLDIPSKPQVITLGDMNLYFIGPMKDAKGNKGSFVFILQYGEKRFMFTGDQEWENLTNNSKKSKKSLDKLKERASNLGTNLQVDIFKWPHHGYNDDDTKDSEFKAFFNEIKASTIVVPNSGSCKSNPQSQARDLVKSLGLGLHGNCDKKNLVITSDGKTIKFHENQSPESWVPSKKVGDNPSDGGQNPTPTQSECKPADDGNDGGGKIGTGIGDATFIDGNGCDDSTIFPGTKYNLTELQIKYVGDRVRRENCGSMIACKAEATQIVNLYEYQHKKGHKQAKGDFWDWFKRTTWYATKYYGLNPNKATEKSIKAVTEVIVKGNRIFPKDITGHDTMELNYPGYKYNITHFYDSSGRKVKFTKETASQPIPGKTMLARRGAENVKFWCIIKYGNNKYGDSFTFR